MNAVSLTPDPVTGLITIGAAFTTTTNIHPSESNYAAFYWLPVLGPLSFLCWTRINQYIPADETSIDIDHYELAWSLGASPTRLKRATTRLTKFHLANIAPTEPDTLRVQRRAPTLSPALLAAISAKCPTLGAAHDEQLHYAA